MTHWLPVRASSYAGDIDHLMILIGVIVGVWLLIAEACLVYFSFRFRRRAGQRAEYLPGNTRKTMAWVLIPVALVLVCDFVIEGASGPVWARIKEERPRPQLVIGIVGRQWSWEFDQPGPDGKLGTSDDIVEMDELHVPAGQVVEFELSAKDVLHSFWVPALRLKQDAVPGRRIHGWFEATRLGTYDILCAQLCGAAHAMMKGKLHVESKADYDRWVATRKES